MPFGALLEAALGVLAVMILFTLLAAAVNEVIADNLRNLRGQTLAEAIGNLLERQQNAAPDTAPAAGQDKPELVRHFFGKAEVQALMRPGRRWFSWFYRGAHKYLPGKERLPSAIEPHRVAQTVLEMFLDPDRLDELEAQAQTEREDYRKLLETTLGALPLDALQKELALRKVGSISALVDLQLSGLRTCLDLKRQEVEAEYAEVVARAQGWYLRSTRKMLFAIGLVLAVGSNIDILGYAERLMLEENLTERAEIARNVVSGLGEDATGDVRLAAEYQSLIANLGRLNVEVGWVCNAAEPEGAGPLDLVPLSHIPCKAAAGTMGYHWPSPSQVIGWLLIAFGVTLGAQFWFDLFKKLVDLRTAGRTLSATPGA